VSKILSSVQNPSDHPDGSASAQPPLSRFKILYELLDRLNRAESLSDIWMASLDAIVAIMQSRHVAVVLLEAGRPARCVAVTGLSPKSCLCLEVYLKNISRCVGSNAALVQRFSNIFGHMMKVEEEIDLVCFVPIGAGDDTVGYLIVSSEAGRIFSEDEIDIASSVANHVFHAVVRYREQESMRESVEQMMIDIQEQRLIKRMLTENERRLLLGFEAGRMGAWEWNVASGCMNWCSRMEILYGYEVGAFPGIFSAYQSSIYPPDRSSVLASLDMAVKRSSHHHMEYRIVMPDGTVRWIEESGRVFREFGGASARMIGVCVDITDRKIRERDISDLRDGLRRRVEELNALFNLLPVGVLIVHDSQCSRVTLNPAAAALLEAPEGKLVLTESDLKKLPFRIFRDGICLTDHEAPLQRVLRSGMSITDEMLELVFDDGRVKSKYMSVVPLFDEAGDVRGTLAALVDMTERKRMEDILKDADRRKDEFLATLAHELRNPLAPIRSSIEILLMKEWADPDVRCHQEIIERQIRHMACLLDDLLDVSRISYNKLDLHRDYVDLSVLVNSAIETSRPLIESGQHCLTVLMPVEPIYLYVDSVRIVQVFSNLLSNAAKYTEPFGQIKIHAERCGNEVLVSVIDNGIGISPEMMSRLFDMFMRGEGPLERSKGGLGIGLSLAYGLVSLHGGSLETYSKGLNQGSKFIVKLPLIDAGEIPVKDGGVCVGATGRFIMVVDDLRDNADSLAALLTMLGHEICVAYSGEEAIELAAKRRPEVVLLDIGMPKMDGYEVCQRLRAQRGGIEITIIALTGWGQQSDRRRSREAGFDYHLVKPVEIAALTEILFNLP
jgi:PAS domain S-box-containing protein